MSTVRDSALTKVRALIAKVLLDPRTEEGRTFAVTAVRLIAQHSLLGSVANSEAQAGFVESPIALALATLQKLSPAEFVMAYDLVLQEARRRAQNASDRLCIECRMSCIADAKDGTADAWMHFPEGPMHIRCVMDHARSYRRR